MRRFGLALLMTACGGAPQLPQVEPVAPEPRPDEVRVESGIPRPIEGTLVLSLEGALELALKGNVPVRLGRLAVEERAGDWFIANERFVPRAILEGRSSQNETPSASSLGGARVIRESVDEGSARVSKTWATGTRTDLIWAHARRSSNSSFLTVNPSHEDTVAFELSQPLLAGFGLDINLTGLQTALANRQLAESDLLLTLDSELLDVTRLYWDLVVAARDLDIHQASRDLSADLLAQTRDRLEIGVAAPLEEVEARAALARQEEHLLEARLAYSTASDRLVSKIRPDDSGQTLQIVPSADPEVTTDLADVDPLDVLISRGLSSRVELKRHESLVEIARLGLLETEDDRLPDLTLTGRYELNGLGSTGDRSRRQLDGADHASWSAGLRLAFLFDSDVRRGAWLQALSRQRSRELQRKFAREEVIREVRAAHRDLRVAAQRVEATLKTLDASREQYEGARDLLESGRSTPFIVNRYRRDLLEAEGNAIRARTRLLMARALLESATGTYAADFLKP